MASRILVQSGKDRTWVVLEDDKVGEQMDISFGDSLPEALLKARAFLFNALIQIDKLAQAQIDQHMAEADSKT